jgi:hypothetical protein
MSVENLRKRLDRVEKVLKPRIEAAAAATAPAPALSQEEEDRQILGLLRLMSGGSSLTAEDKAELERLRALYPYEEPEEVPRSQDELISDLIKEMQEIEQLTAKGEW